MLSLDLNLAARPFKNDTLPWVGLGLALVTLTLLTVWNVRTYRKNSEWVEDLKHQYSTTRSELDTFDRRERGAQRKIEGYDLDALHVRAGKANEVILWKAFSWTQLFNRLEEVLPNDVQMISVRPIFRPQGADNSSDDSKAGLVPVSVEGVAKSLTAFFNLETSLLAHPNFHNVEPEGHTRSRSGSLAFELKFRYEPAIDPSPAETEAEAAAGSGPLPEDGEESQDPTAGAAAGAETDPEEQQPDDDGEQDDGTRRAALPETPSDSVDGLEASGAGSEKSAEAVAPEKKAGSTDPAAAETKKKKRPKPPGRRRGGRTQDTKAQNQGGGQ